MTRSKLEQMGDRMVYVFHTFGLFVIGAVVVWASWLEMFAIFEHGGPTIKDILLLFMYLELGAMVGIYFKTHRLPVRFLIYIAITALTRLLALDAKEMADMHMLTITGSILLLCLSVLALRFGSTRLREQDSEDEEA